MADPGSPAAPARPAGRVGAAADRGVGPGVRSAHQLPPVPHGAAAAQAGGQPGASPASAHRTGDGVPLPALTPGLTTTFPLIGHACFAGYSAECEARDLPWGADEATGRGRSARDR